MSYIVFHEGDESELPLDQCCPRTQELSEQLDPERLEDLAVVDTLFCRRVEDYREIVVDDHPRFRVKFQDKNDKIQVCTLSAEGKLDASKVCLETFPGWAVDVVSVEPLIGNENRVRKIHGT